MNETDLLRELLAVMNSMSEAQKHPNCNGGCPCSCPTNETFESSAARYSDRASNVAAESMQSYSLAAASQNAALLALQARITGLPGTSGSV